MKTYTQIFREYRKAVRLAQKNFDKEVKELRQTCEHKKTVYTKPYFLKDPYWGGLGYMPGLVCCTECRKEWEGRWKYAQDVGFRVVKWPATTPNSKRLKSTEYKVFIGKKELK
jgi:hypothetical protein